MVDGPALGNDERWSAVGARLTDIAGSLASEAETATAMVRQVADHAAEIAALADRLRAAANAIEAGVRDQASDLADARMALSTNRPTIDGLVQSVDSVAAISLTIAQIARQSQMLGLNARIEASRAGSDGRGFAAVAQELSTLANQTKVATDDIAGRAGVIAHDVESARTIVAAHGDLVLTQDALLATTLDNAAVQRDAAAALAAITADAAQIVGDAAAAMGRVATSATAVKLLARQIGRRR